MNGVAPTPKLPVVWEKRMLGYRLWADEGFADLVKDVPGIVKLRPVTAHCWEVMLDPRYDVHEIEAAVLELAWLAHAEVGKWIQ